MKEFNYCVTDSAGLHARPAGLLVKFAKDLESKVTVEHNGKSADASRLFSVMGLGVKQNDTVLFQLEGPHEAEDAAKLENFCRNTL